MPAQLTLVRQGHSQRRYGNLPLEVCITHPTRHSSTAEISYSLLLDLSILLAFGVIQTKQVLRWPRIEQCHHIERLDVGAFPLCLERKSKAVCDLFAVVGNNVHAQDQSNHTTSEARVVQVVLLATQLLLAPANVLADCLPVHGQTASTRLRRSPIPPRSRYPLPSPYRLHKWITRAVAVEFTLATRLFSPSSTTPRSSLIALHKTAPGGVLTAEALLPEARRCHRRGAKSRIHDGSRPMSRKCFFWRRRASVTAATALGPYK